MELRIDFSSLTSAVQRMGAHIRDVPLGDFRLEDIDPVSIDIVTGIEVDLKDVEVNPGRLLGYKGYQVVLYIPDQGWRIESVLDNPSEGKKVHVANCITLDEMKRRGRIERYVVRNGLSPNFLVSGKTREGEEIEGEAELRVCMNCMKLLNYKNFNNKRGFVRKAVVNEFSLEQFFATYSSYFKYMPMRKAEDISSNHYSENWKEVSRRYRENLGWKCEGCSVDLSTQAHRKLLHVHHINGVKGDDSPNNLKALCVDCHSKEEMHEHLFVKKADRSLIQRLRRDQSVYRAPRASSYEQDDWELAFETADPAVHGLLYELQAQEYPVPEVGADIIDKATQRVIYSNVELAWMDLFEVVVLEKTEESEMLKNVGWKVFTAQELLDWLNSESN